jgi:hypothetical protein
VAPRYLCAHHLCVSSVLDRIVYLCLLASGRTVLVSTSWPPLSVILNFVQSLCNACGIRFKKEERRAAAMESTVGCRYEYAAAVAKAFPCCGGGDVDANAPFLAWRLNVVAPAPAFAAVWPERTSLFPHN